MTVPKVVILCGGRGTRLNEETHLIPKPLIKVDDKPILWHIMNIYSYYGFNDFVLCLGYKGQLIKEYFSAYSQWNIEFVETGLETGTAGRVKKIKEYVGERFFLTYGDGLSDVNILKLEEFHNSHGGISTVTAVRPLARFGMLNLKNDKVVNFKKYSQASQGWIDGGFFVFDEDIFNYIGNCDDKEMLEGRILEDLARTDKFCAFKHEGYWKCIDTYRDLLDVRKDIETSNDKWNTWRQ